MNIFFQTTFIRKMSDKYFPIQTSLYIWLKHILFNFTNSMYTKVIDIITHKLPSNWNMGVAEVCK
jgi:ABC-type microcin C transport system permease subunit YejB